MTPIGSIVPVHPYRCHLGCSMFRELRTSHEFGALIREGRKRSGLSQTEFAQKIGASRKWVAEIEAGKEAAELSRVLRALQALGIAIGISDEKDQVRATEESRASFRKRFEGQNGLFGPFSVSKHPVSILYIDKKKGEGE